jgi:hypothetical protein
MRKPPKDSVREDRIENEAIADAYGSEEKAMSWHCYLESKVRFPFRATCIAAKITSPLKKGELPTSNVWRLKITAPMTCWC